MPLPMAWTAFGPVPYSSTSAIFGVCDNKFLCIAVSLEAVDKVLGVGGLKRMLCYATPG